METSLEIFVVLLYLFETAVESWLSDCQLADAPCLQDTELPYQHPFFISNFCDQSVQQEALSYTHKMVVVPVC